MYELLAKSSPSLTKANVPSKLVEEGIQIKTDDDDIPTQVLVEGLPTRLVGITYSNESCLQCEAAPKLQEFLKLDISVLVNLLDLRPL